MLLLLLLNKFTYNKQIKLKSCHIYRKFSQYSLIYNDRLSIITNYLTKRKELLINKYNYFESKINTDTNGNSKELYLIQNLIMDTDVLYNKINDIKEFYEFSLLLKEKDNEYEKESNNMLYELEDTIYKIKINDYMHGIYINNNHNNNSIINCKNNNENSLLYIKKLNSSNCFLHIQAGAGGDDACEWVSMTKDMYINWCNANSLQVNIVEQVNNDNNSIGIRNITLHIIANNDEIYPYGWLKLEAGIHRLVRISPYDPMKKRHTSFCMVMIYPDYNYDVLEKCVEWMKLEYYKIDTFRSSGPGGQNVNKTDSAIRITHLPSGLIVTCQNERSQLQNKKIAFSLLNSKIVDYINNEKNTLKQKNLLGNESINSFGGGHIRSVILHPYTLVKDHRSNWSINNSIDVEYYLNGKGNILQSAMNSIIIS